MHTGTFAGRDLNASTIVLCEASCGERATRAAEPAYLRSSFHPASLACPDTLISGLPLSLSLPLSSDLLAIERGKLIPKPESIESSAATQDSSSRDALCNWQRIRTNRIQIW